MRLVNLYDQVTDKAVYRQYVKDFVIDLDKFQIIPPGDLIQPGDTYFSLEVACWRTTLCTSVSSDIVRRKR